MSLLSFTEFTGEAVAIPFNEPSQTGIVQERVILLMNCLPWLNRFQGGIVEWSRVPLDAVMVIFVSHIYIMHGAE